MSPTFDHKLDVTKYVGTSFVQKGKCTKGVGGGRGHGLVVMHDVRLPGPPFHCPSFPHPLAPLPSDLPLSELAVHIQGHPLIRPTQRKKREKTNSSSSSSSSSQVSDKDSECSSKENESEKLFDILLPPHMTQEVNLPRIIKPRKRRKKDKKIMTTTSPSQQTGPITLKPYAPLCYYNRNNGRSQQQAPAKTPVVKSASTGGERKLSGVVVSVKQALEKAPRSKEDAREEVLLQRLTQCSIYDGSRAHHPEIRRSHSEPYKRGRRLSESQDIILQQGGFRKQRYSAGDIEELNQEECICLPPRVSAPQPPQRPWIPVSRPDKDRPSCIFTVMCYNVLCDKYATRQMYAYCPNWALEWRYRRKGILTEIRTYSADIITLQEVETEQFYNFFEPELKAHGYQGIFSPKSRAKTMSETERRHVDGCAIFYRVAKFSLVKEFLVEFNQLAIANAEGSEDMLNRVMTKDNIGLAAILETKEGWQTSLGEESPQQILVSTCHIHWDPEYCDVKLIQTMMLMHELRSIARSHQVAALLLCGDLNSLPDSGVVEFLTTGQVPANHQDFKDLDFGGCLQKLSSSSKADIFTQPFKLSSAYSPDIMPFTNYTYDFKGVIDYIFYSKTQMRPLGLLGPIDPDWFNVHKILGCPHPHMPSDHFPLLTELELCSNLSPPPNGMIMRR